jgi:hypothetical protein
MSEPVNPSGVQLATAAAQALLPVAGPYGVLADQVLTAGLAFWADYQAKKAAGNLTMADLESAAAKASMDLSQFAADVAAMP